MATWKPAGTEEGSWVDSIIRRSRPGDSDNLPGSGRPIEGLDRPHDELWWVHRRRR